MWFVKYGEEYLHDPRVGLILPATNPTVEVNTSTTFVFNISANHPMYNKIREYDPDNPVVVYQGDTIIYKGEIIHIEADFELTKAVTCKSDLGYFNHSILRPYSTLKEECDRISPSTVNGYFEFLVSEHNGQASKVRQFKMGINEGSMLDVNNYIYRSDSTYPTVGSVIKSKVIDALGGYLRVRYESDDQYIDLLSDMPNANSQIIDFGKNLLDFVSNEGSEELATFIVPIGKTIEKNSDTESDKLSINLNIGPQAVVELSKERALRKKELDEAMESFNNLSSNATPEQIAEAQKRIDDAKFEYDFSVDAVKDAKAHVPDGKLEDGYYKLGDVIYSDEAVRKYGWIGSTIEFKDVGLVSNLIKKGILTLKSIMSPIRTIEVKAIDLSLIDKSLKPIYVGDYVRVRSNPHNFDSYMLCTKIEYDLNDPKQNVFTLGTTIDTLTGQQNKRINDLNANINTVYEAAAKLSAEAKANASLAEQAKTTADAAIKKSIDEYVLSESYHVAPTTGWSEQTPEWQDDRFYIWRRLKNIHGDGSVTYGTPAVMTGNSGKDAILLRIDSSRGTVFKNSAISTVLTVRIFYGDQKIENPTALYAAFGPRAYLEWKWLRKDEDVFGIISSSDPRLSNGGFNFTLSPVDVDTKVTFSCDLII